MSIKAIVFGIDGFSFEVANNLLERGLLPNLAGLIRQGSWGSLKSTFPPHTAPGWVSMFTGVGPGEHGIYQFWQTKNDQYKAVVTSVHDYSWEPLWETLEKQGFTAGVVNVPMTHPPTERQGNGYMITWPLSPTIHYSYPKSLVAELARSDLHFHSDLVTMYRGQEDYFDQAVGFMQGRTKTLLYLMENRPVDVLFAVYTEVDRVSHYYWGQETQPSEKVERIYIETDKALGEILDKADKNALVIVASDHGFGNCSANVNVHAILEGKGLLRTRLVAAERVSSLEGSDAQIGKEEEGGRATWFRSASSYFREIDWPQTKVYMPTPGCFGLNINLKGREQQGIVETTEIEAIERQLKKCFDEFTDENGRQAFELVPCSDVYKGRCLEQAPDYLLKPRRWDIMPHTGMEPEIWTKPTQPAVHRPDGFWAVRGKTIPANNRQPAKIEDIAPTLLAHLGCTLYTGLTGIPQFKDLETINFTDAPVIDRENTARLSEQEDSLLQSKLQDLGYV